MTEAPTRLRGRILFATVAMLGLVGGVGGWAATARLGGAVISAGQIAVDRHLKVVQHRDGGIVGEIHVREGDRVAQGQVILELTDAQTEAELSIVAAQLRELMLRAARLAAERDGLAELVFPPLPGPDSPAAESIAEGERRLFEGNARARESRKRQLALGIVQIEEELQGLTVQLAAKDEEIALQSAEHDRLASLLARDLIEMTRVAASQREMVLLRGARGEIIASIARAKARISEIELQILAIDQDARTEAQRQLTEIEARLAELRDRHAAISDRLARNRVRAPIAGVVNEIHVHSLGSVVTPAQVLATILPEDARLKVATKVAPVDIEQVRLGGPVRMRFTAFNQRVTPEIAGSVSFIAPAATWDETLGGHYYSADIAVAEGGLDSLGKDRLRPGMPVEIYISTEERTVLSYLLRPFTDQVSRALRER